ncbi:hypothetical protein Daud_0961 [Candidatus Desulforudis audaxviator MP104C]|uniref:Bacterial repeat domain-containing protein n=2 Tax=Candidatus Desulforudis TaxID=471826 RepID=B1I3F1_DESAP|nr:hypothetical protein Daud_0961 [Candidatus Desulforudis audaxviator MP104C]
MWSRGGQNMFERGPGNNKGLTLVELLVGAALLGAVLAIGYTFFYFGHQSFTAGEQRSWVRQNIRLAADFITQELRYATHVYVLGSVPQSFAADLNYIYVKDGVLKHRKAGGGEDTVFDRISEGVVLKEDLGFSLDGEFLAYRVANSGEDAYAIDGRIRLLNPLADSSGKDGVAVAYKSERPAETPPERYTLTVSVAEGNGTTSPEAGDHVYEKNTTVPLTAFPADGWVFKKWLINGVNITTATTTIVMNKDIEARAYFVDKYDFYDFLQDQNVFVYGGRLVFEGEKVEGRNATIVIKGNLGEDDLNKGSHIDVKTIYIDGSVDLDGGSADLGAADNTGSIYINGDLTLWKGKRDVYGNVYVAGNLRLKDAVIHGNIYVNGNVELGWTPDLKPNARIYYTGTLTHPKRMSPGIISKCIKVDSVPGFVVPDFGFPALKPDAWYAANGYVSGGALTSGIKIYADNYSSTAWRPTAHNVVIVSKGDITITRLGGSGVSGVLYAPNGRVTFEGEFFEGVVIARDGFFVTRGGTTVTFKHINTFFSSVADYPFLSE